MKWAGQPVSTANINDVDIVKILKSYFFTKISRVLSHQDIFRRQQPGSAKLKNWIGSVRMLNQNENIIEISRLGSPPNTCNFTTKIKAQWGHWGLHSTEVAHMLLAQQPQVWFPAFPQKHYRGKIIDVAEINQHPWLEESGQWPENVDRTHLALASGKPVLQKI